MHTDWTAHQAYFTRAQRQKFAAESGYGVVDASRWFDEARASRYIDPIGQYTLFDYKNTSSGGRQENESMYLILPSADGCLSISRAFDTVDEASPPRSTPFLHTYLLEPDDARKCLRGNMFQADAARVETFNREYVGHPDYDGDLPDDIHRDQLLSGTPPDKLCIADAGFTPEYMLRLINTIICVNKMAYPNLRRVFVVYDCRRDEFLIKSRNLLTLLYSCLPYSLTANLGAVIKTDAIWRSDIPAAYSKAYLREAADMDYFPGVELFIVNRAISQPDKCQIFMVGGNGGIRVSREIPIEPLNRDLINDMVCSLDEINNPDKSLRAFHIFMQNLFDDEMPFDELCQFYALFINLRHPEKLAGLSRRELQVQIRALTDCFNQPSGIKDAIANMRLGSFFDNLFDRVSSLVKNDTVTEMFWIRLLELLTASKTSYVGASFDEYLGVYYKLLRDSGIKVESCEKLKTALMGDESLFTSLTVLDEGNLVLGDMYDIIIREESLSALSLLSRYFAGRASEDIQTLYRFVSKLYYEHEDKEIEAAVGKGGFEEKIRVMLKLMRLNKADAKRFDAIMDDIQNMDMNPMAVELASNRDGWNARIFLKKLSLERDHIKVRVSGFSRGYQAVLDRGDEDEIASLEGIIKQWFGSAEDGVGLLLRFQEKRVAPEPGESGTAFTIDWNALATGAVDKVKGNIPPLTTINKWVSEMLTDAERYDFTINFNQKALSTLLTCVTDNLERLNYKDAREALLYSKDTPFLNTLNIGVYATYMMRCEFENEPDLSIMSYTAGMRYSQVLYCYNCNTPNAPERAEEPAEAGLIKIRKDKKTDGRYKCASCGEKFDEHRLPNTHAVMVTADMGVLDQIPADSEPGKKSLLGRIVPAKRPGGLSSVAIREYDRRGYKLHKIDIRSYDDKSWEAYAKYIRGSCLNTSVIIRYADRDEWKNTRRYKDIARDKKCVLLVKDEGREYPVAEILTDGSCRVFYNKTSPKEFVECIAAYLALGGVWL